MKYLTQEAYDSGNWQKACDRLDKAFKKIKKYFPEAFLEEFLEGDFHDCTIVSMKFNREDNDSTNLNIKMIDGYENGVYHYLTIKKITNIKMNMNIGCSVWLYAEILPIKKEKYIDGKRFSLEIAFPYIVSPDDKSLYVEFGSIAYEKKSNL